MNQLLDAWSVWIAGSKTEALPLWGSTVIWWGRAGKAAEFAAGLAIIAEIIGTERLRSYGRSLHGLELQAVARKVVSTAWGLARDVVNADPEMRDSTRPRRAMRDIAADNPAMATLYVLICLALGLTLSFSEGGSLWRRTLYFIVGVIFLWSTVAPMILIAFIVALASLGSLFDALVLRPTAWILEQEQLAQMVKIGSLLLLAAGFHFDLLAS
jgi:hypothetical protein